MSEPSYTLESGQAKLLVGPVAPTLFRMTLPMVAGVLAMMLYNIVDTYFVGRLGGDPLAAMGFTFSITQIIMGFALALMIGTSTVLARLIGAGDVGQVRRITTDALLLSGCSMLALGGMGIFFLDRVFSAMGAEPHLLPTIRQYMVPYFAGVALLAIPMVGNGAIRATGDTKYPSLIMISSAIVNIALDPLLIFGLGPFPRLELRGAAYANHPFLGIHPLRGIFHSREKRKNVGNTVCVGSSHTAVVGKNLVCRCTGCVDEYLGSGGASDSHCDDGDVWATCGSWFWGWSQS